MAKMFYTLEEAAAKLGKSSDEVMQLAESGQLPEFRDRDKVMFKREHVDLLAGSKDEDDMIPLADSGELEAITLASSGSASGMSLDNPKEQTGISIFDADTTEEADPSAVTRVTSAPTLGDVGKGGSGSGSGLLDTMRETDDTSLGANLLDEVYGNETVAQQTAVDAGGEVGEAGALFESPAASSEETVVGNAAMVAMVPEVYDGPGSGLVGGAAIGATAALLLAAFAVLLSMTGAGGSLLQTLGDNLWAVVGGAAGLVLIATLLGWFLGRRS